MDIQGPLWGAPKRSEGSWRSPVPRTLMETSMEAHGAPWRPPWRLMELHGDLHGGSWSSMELRGGLHGVPDNVGRRELPPEGS